MNGKLRLALTAMVFGCLLTACAEQEPQQSVNLSAQETEETLPAVPTFTLAADVNPYTGLQKNASYPEGVRSAAFMVDNVKTALPQSGINSADLLYEVVTEGGITRLMAVFRDVKSMPVVGPLRSAREPHVQLAIPLGSLYAHIGGSAGALELLDAFKYPDRLSLNGKYKNFYWIDAQRRKVLPQDGCIYTDGTTFADAARRYGLDTTGEPAPVFNFVPYAQPRRQLAGGEAQEVSVRFSGYDETRLVYDPARGRYDKYEFDGPQIDTADDSRPYSADNVFVLFTQIGKAPDKILAQVALENGAGLYFCGGRYERVRWMKGAGEAPLRIVDNNGRELDVTVNPGQSYIALVGMDQLGNCRVDGMSLEELLGEAG